MNTHTMGRDVRTAAALTFLENLLVEGRSEFPDACARAAQSFSVTADEVRLAYDEAMEVAWQHLQDDKEARHEEGVAAAYQARGQGNLY